MSIAVIGTIFMDIKGYPFAKLSADGRNPGRVEYVHGGVGRNVAEDLARIGVKANLVSLADFGGAASDIISRLNAAGVGTEFIGNTETGMGTWLAVFNHEGEVVSSISVRSDLTPLVEVLDKEHERIFKDADSIIIETDIDEPVLERVFYYAEKYGKRVFALVSVMSIARQRMEYIKKTECFICNLEEASLLFGFDLSGKETDEIRALIKEKAVRAGLKRVIVTMSEKGAVYLDSDGSTGFCPAEKVALVDAAGAGDSFCAASAAALTYGKSMKEACEIGSKVAAEVITTTENVPPFMKIFS